MTTALFAFLVAWKFLAADTAPVVAMEWKRVLDSPLSAETRKEIPVNAIPVLSGINFIEGIERVTWTPGLVVLEGSFDTVQLRGAGVADGGVVTQYRQMELVAPPEKDGTAMALSPSTVLIGTADAVRAAIDRSEKRKSDGSGSGFDLWIRTTGTGFTRHDFGLRLGDSIHISSDVSYMSPESAQSAAMNAGAMQLSSTPKGHSASFTATFTPDKFRSRQWRTAIESLHTVAPAKADKKPGMIRIYGLDEGVKEIPLK